MTETGLVTSGISDLLRKVIGKQYGEIMALTLNQGLVTISSKDWCSNGTHTWIFNDIIFESRRFCIVKIRIINSFRMLLTGGQKSPWPGEFPRTLYNWPVYRCSYWHLPSIMFELNLSCQEASPCQRATAWRTLTNFVTICNSKTSVFQFSVQHNSKFQVWPLTYEALVPHLNGDSRTNQLTGVLAATIYNIDCINWTEIIGKKMRQITIKVMNILAELIENVQPKRNQPLSESQSIFCRLPYVY